jgi:hypothetical protein
MVQCYAIVQWQLVYVNYYVTNKPTYSSSFTCFDDLKCCHQSSFVRILNIHVLSLNIINMFYLRSKWMLIFCSIERLSCSSGKGKAVSVS